MANRRDDNRLLRSLGEAEIPEDALGNDPSDVVHFHGSMPDFCGSTAKPRMFAAGIREVTCPDCLKLAASHTVTTTKGPQKDK